MNTGTQQIYTQVQDPTVPPGTQVYRTGASRGP